VCDDAGLGQPLLVPNVGHDHGAVVADPHLRAMGPADANPLGEAERAA
jgi:hypothetical protein